MSAFWSVARVTEALATAPSRVGGASADRAYTAVETDTRTLGAGALFVALRGERFDGHDFLPEAVARDVWGVVVDHRFWEVRADEAPAGPDYFIVPDTLEALGWLGRERRRALAARVCAITGTNGKTAAKDMTRAVLATRYRVHATAANLNNLVGTPQTLLSAPDQTEVIVVEVGSNAPGEIARLGAVTEPDAAVITNVAEGHLEGLGDVEGVMREKLALVESLRPDGVALVGEEPLELAARARALHARVRVAGYTERADQALRAGKVDVDEDGRPRFHWGEREVRLRYRGRHHVRNAMLALGVGAEWGVDPGPALDALGALEPPALRTQLIRYGDLRVLADCYNANPPSTEAAAELLAELPRGGGRVAVLGSMLELGDAAAELHAETARRVALRDIDLIVATGEFAGAFGETPGSAEVIDEVDPLRAGRALAERLRGDEVVLLKGSRGVALERLLPLLESVGRGESVGENGERGAQY
ncbi:MAG: UDP-N-acetylmuramoyl-tripeptide--D-alanyl-D-alanine ligase [Gemmatimonadota bacterium]